ncbi:hypothetical protein [Streptomyces alfalfae]|uniref:hypothetical protein n=1 Tax=Streptomyces alfalfae TaxID=1642299 RepID=UPI001E4966DC|nr:hypothetical protein [Streptomyces alfalfae]
MSHELLSPDMSIALDAPQNSAPVSEWLLGTSAPLMQHQGEIETAELIAEVTSLEVRLWNKQVDQEGYRVVLVVEPRLYPRYDETALKRIEKAMDMVLVPSGKDIDEIAVRPENPTPCRWLARPTARSSHQWAEAEQPCAEGPPRRA